MSNWFPENVSTFLRFTIRRKSPRLSKLRFALPDRGVHARG